MEDMYAELRTLVEGLRAVVVTHKGEDVVALDLTKLSSWTDFFIIATVSSSTHRSAVQKYACEYARERGLEVHNSGKKTASDDEWTLVDLGPIVIHLMSANARSFYELERLWAQAERL